MAQLMNESQRLATLEAFNPKDHLIGVGKDRQGKVTMYYPAAWRLYELNLRYPNANFKSEIIYHNEEKGTVIVKAYLYLGTNYEDSDKKAEAMKQGNISSLDKVETAAKARAARDFGIGTEYALDMVPDETDATHDVNNGSNEAQPAPVSAVPSRSQQNGASTPTPLTPKNSTAPASNTAPKLSQPSSAVLNMLKRAKSRAEQLNLDWESEKANVLGKAIPDNQLTVQHLASINGDLTKAEQQQKAS